MQHFLLDEDQPSEDYLESSRKIPKVSTFHQNRPPHRDPGTSTDEFAPMANRDQEPAME
jgi:hypothetical protein